MDFKIDKPITNKNQDLLERANFAQKIANAIQTMCDKNENAVIGLQGAWGSGKTSLINMIEECLNKTKKETQIEVLRFESWLTTDREDLFNEFFTCIAEGLERDGRLHYTAKEIIAYGNRYIKRIAKATNVTVGLSGSCSAAIDIGKIIDEEKPETLFKKKTIINEKLAGKEVPYFVFFIDDIDRLSYDEIAILFQLIKNIADFKKVIYVLSYDPVVVGEALNKLHNDKGYKYIEKVVQIPINIPHLTEKRLEEYFNKLICDVVAEYPDELIDKVHLQGVYVDGIQGYLKTMRDCNRVINAVKIKFDLVGDSVDLGDLLGITTIELFEPEFFNRIYDSKEIFLGVTAGGLMEMPAVVIKETWDKIKVDCHINDLKCLSNILKLMFPRFGKAAKEEGGFYSQHSCKITSKIRDYACFDRYFTLRLQQNSVSRVEVLTWLRCADEAKYREVLLYWQEKGMLYHALSTAREMVLNGDANAIYKNINFLYLLRAISKVNLCIDSLGMFMASEYSLARWLINDILDRVDNLKELLADLFEDDEISLSVLCNLIIDMSAGYEWCYGSEELKNARRILNESQFESANIRFINRVKHESGNDSFLSQKEIFFILVIWKYRDLENYKKYIAKHTTRWCYAKFACIFVNDGMVHSSDKGSYRLVRLDYKSWFEELDFDVAIQSVEALIADGCLNNFSYRDQIKLKAFVILAEEHKKNLELGLVNQRVEIPLGKIENLLTIPQ